jgi:hypothetical protein
MKAPEAASLNESITASGSLKDALTRLIKASEPVASSLGTPSFGQAYQLWYTPALKVVSTLAPDRLAEFRGLYEGDPKRKGIGSLDSLTYTIRDYLAGVVPSDYRVPDTSVCVRNRLCMQIQILASLETRIGGVLANITAHLFSEIQDLELAAARRLQSTSQRAAGALAGVVLERHLQEVAKNRNVQLNKKAPTLSDWNDALKAVDAYDTAPWRRIQHLADIRNLCCHNKDREPTSAEVDDLIQSVHQIARTVL